MAEGTYEYECMRAELLGIAKPDYDDFLQRQKDEQLAKEVADEQIETECLTVKTKRPPRFFCLLTTLCFIRMWRARTPLQTVFLAVWTS